MIVLTEKKTSSILKERDNLDITPLKPRDAWLAIIALIKQFKKVKVHIEPMVMGVSWSENKYNKFRVQGSKIMFLDIREPRNMMVLLLRDIIAAESIEDKATGTKMIKLKLKTKFVVKILQI